MRFEEAISRCQRALKACGLSLESQKNCSGTISWFHKQWSTTSWRPGRPALMQRTAFVDKDAQSAYLVWLLEAGRERSRYRTTC
jgi:hypothetical protein